VRSISNAAKVGFLAIGSAVAAWLLYQAVEERSGDRNTYRVYAIFEDASGLAEKSRVEIAGISVGYIDKISLAARPDGTSAARIDLAMHGDVPLYGNDAQGRSGATIRRQMKSLLGEYSLVLTPGTPDESRRLPDGAIIPNVIVEGGLFGVMDQMGDVVTEIGEIAREVKGVARQLSRTFGTDAGGDQMREALRNIAEMAESVNRSVQENSILINRSLQNIEGVTREGGPEIRQILVNTRMITEQVRDMVGRGEGQVDQTVGSISETLDSMNSAAQRLDRVLAHAENVARSVDEGEGTVGRLVRDDHLIDEVEGAVEGAGEFIGQVSRLQTIVGLRSDYNLLSASVKSTVELRLAPREDKYYLIQLIDDPRGRTSYSSTVYTNQGGPVDQPVQWRQDREVTEDAFRFSVQFARRISWATFRFGLIESTGGVGLDLHLFDDNLEIQNDLFAFGEGVFPRERTSAAWEFLSHMWVHAGIDDALNTDRTDYFFGGQLRFNDEDLKAILTVAPSP